MLFVFFALNPLIWASGKNVVAISVVSSSKYLLLEKGGLRL